MLLFPFFERGQRKASASAKVRNQSCSFDLCSIGTRRKYGHPFQYSIPLETLYKEWQCATIVVVLAAAQDGLAAASTFCPPQKHPIRHLAVSTATIRCSHDIHQEELTTIPINATLSLLFWHHGRASSGMAVIRKTVSGFCSNLNMYAMSSGSRLCSYSFVFTIHARLTTAWLLRLFRNLKAALLAKVYYAICIYQSILKAIEYRYSKVCFAYTICGHKTFLVRQERSL